MKAHVETNWSAKVKAGDPLPEAALADLRAIIADASRPADERAGAIFCLHLLPAFLAAMKEVDAERMRPVDQAHGMANTITSLAKSFACTVAAGRPFAEGLLLGRLHMVIDGGLQAMIGELAETFVAPMPTRKQ